MSSKNHQVKNIEKYNNEISIGNKSIKYKNMQMKNETDNNITVVKNKESTASMK